jgi:hypothetical protein
MRRLAGLIIIVVFSFALGVGADTIQMKSGAVVNGKVLRETASEITLEHGSTTIVLSKSLIARIEKDGQVRVLSGEGHPANASTGTPQPAARPAGNVVAFASPAPVATLGVSAPAAPGVTPLAPFLPPGSGAAAPIATPLSPFTAQPGASFSVVQTPLAPVQAQETLRSSAETSSEQKWTVQTIATKDATAAKGMADALVGLGYSNVYMVYEAPYYKTRVGPYGSREEVGRVNTQLESELKQQCWLTEESRTVQEIKEATQRTAQGILPPAEQSGAVGQP